jgi:hypothetical protein
MRRNSCIAYREIEMNKAILTVMTTGVAAVSLSVASAAFAGGNGNGGAGNAHGAATAGMTYGGDPIDSPWVTKPAGMTTDHSNATMPSSSDTSNTPTTQAKMDPQ